jgi:hypothetical protein
VSSEAPAVAGKALLLSQSSETWFPVATTIRTISPTAQYLSPYAAFPIRSKLLRLAVSIPAQAVEGASG